MRSEAAFWADWLQPLLHRPAQDRIAWKVPAELRKGLPDVWYAGEKGWGWIELKYEPTWPLRATTALEVDLSLEQHAHLTAAATVGQGAWVLFGVHRDWFLFQSTKCTPHMRLTRDELASRSTGHGRRRTDDTRLLRLLGLG